MTRPWEVSRRACLRGAGTMIGLPVLEAMLPGMKRARAAGVSTPQRLVFFVFTGGIPDTTGLNIGINPGPGSFWPAAPGPDFKIPRILEPFQDPDPKKDLTKDILVVRNLDNRKGEMPDGRGGHATAPNSLLTGEEPGAFPDPTTTDNPTKVGTSADQMAANHFKKVSPSLLVPSLYLGNPFHSDQAGQLMCWKNPTTRAPYIDQPSAAFRTVFGDNTVDAKTLQRRIAYRQSVLHHAKAATDRLKKTLGQADLERLARYLDSVHDLEAQIMAAKNVGQCADPGSPPPDPAVQINPLSPDTGSRFQYQVDLAAHFQSMSEVIVHAFQCDRTRVVVVQLYTHALRFSWLASPYDQYATWHGDIEHGAAEVPAEPDRAKAYIEGCKSQVAQFAYLVKRLKETPESDGSGSLLDNSALVCTSELSHGSGHSMRHVPVVVAGGAGGLVKRGQGRYMVAPEATPIYNLWVTMLNAVGVKDSAGRDVTSVGSGSTGALSLG